MRAGPHAPQSGAGQQFYDAGIVVTAAPPIPVADRADRFPTLEGLRAVAALSVLAFHAGTFTGLTGPGGGTAGSWVRHLNVGVSVFFVLSAFLLYRPFVLAHLRDDPAPAVGRYAARRLVRIFPAYWLALTVSAYVLDQAYLGDWWGQLRFYLLGQIYWGETASGGLAQAWSLCTELSFYLFLPLWALLLARVRGSVERRRRVHLAGCVVLYAVGVAFRAALRDGGHALGYAWLPANTDLFALGMWLAVASADSTVRRVPAGGLWRTLGERPAVGWLAAACCYGAVVGMGFPFEFLQAPTASEEVARQALFGLVALLVVAPGVFGAPRDGVVRRVLASRPLHALGVVSYGIYLWHLMVLVELDERLRPEVGIDGVVGASSWWALTAGAVVISTALATASWFLVERPLIRLVRRGGGHERIR